MSTPTVTTDPAGAAVGRVAARADGIPLAAVLASAELQQRVDRKYLVLADAVEELLGPVLAATRCLEIDGVRRFRYRSVYFDTPDLRLFRDHVQGRRIRAKVRTRTYADSGECALEVKRTGGRDLTLKDRLPWPVDRADRLDGEGVDFVRRRLVLPGREHLAAQPLAATATTAYRRSTFLVGPGERVTVDTGLVLGRAGRRAAAGPGWVLVESKTAGPRGVVDRALARGGHRPVAVSKYCLAVALLEPGMPGNAWHRIMRRQFGWSTPAPSVGAA